MRNGIVSVLLALFLCSIVCGAEISIYFFDVGNGDAIFVDGHDGYDVLIDLASSAQPYLERIAAMIEDGVLDLLVITHYHVDHYGGIAGLLRQFPQIRVKRALSPGMHPSESELVKSLPNIEEWLTARELLEGGHLKPGGYTVQEGAGYRWILLGPVSLSTRMDDAGINNSSVVLKLETPGLSVLFMGDAEKDAEQELLRFHYGISSTLSADVLKVGHHGSSTSTSPELLQAVTPRLAVISCSFGEGFPRPETLKRLEDRGIKHYSTALYGTIRLILQEVAYSVETEFKPFTITATAGPGCAIAPEGKTLVRPGANQTFSLASTPGYTVRAVFVDGVSVGSVSTYTFTNVRSDHTIHVECCQAGSVSSYATRVVANEGWNDGRATGDPNKVCSTCNRARVTLELGGFTFTLPATATVSKIQVDIVGARINAHYPVKVRVNLEGQSLPERILYLPEGNCGSVSARSVWWDVNLPAWAVRNLTVSINSGDGFGWRYVDAVRVTLVYQACR